MPILSELDSLSPGAKSALAQAHSRLATSLAPSPVAPVAGETASPGAMDLPFTPQRPSPMLGGGSPQPNAAPTPSPIVPQKPVPTLGPRVQSAEDEVQRVRDSGSGISQIHNPFLRGLGYVGDAVASGLFPRIASVIPGTSAHHQQVLGGAEQNLKTEQGIESQGVTEAEKEAQTANLDAQPELRHMKADLDTEKQHEVEANHDAQNEIKKSGNKASLHEHGFDEDPDGNIVPLAYEKMSVPQQAAHDLKASQQELTEANAAYKKAQQDNLPAQMKIAQQRADNARSNQSVALQKLGYQREALDAKLYGTGKDGAPLAGSLFTDDGRSVGTANAANVRPTAQERSKADLADSVNTQVATMRDILKRKPELFGPGNGRVSQLQLAIGNNDPEALKFKAASDYLAEHSAGMFGSRSSQIVHDLQQLDSPHFNIPSLNAALDQAELTAKGFKKSGTPRTAGSDAAKAATHSEARIPYTANGKTYNIPASQEQEFLKDFPTAKKNNASK